ncbi:ketoacyl-synt-domain-containing protein [Tilletiaria anomala UBC 951]|uniref:Ketoacyl-synt-domain-containing protein n=1 Tax=Tilletiaria anomala (strain ATCC 24038 / CBS 436.72 / UBC 951) TaxID=1037660 RepID=A0A066WFU1_TILAU|nr:ketoacyl-synt-domain-containing protein [Tilletiaria anomala UBC 951]KDN52671.1 ketoacyl-synt-domain-containing protein [Tilletiaria anomala UBC 951]
MAQLSGSEEPNEHPLYFLHRNPVVSILGDPLNFDLRAQVLTVGKIAKTNPTLRSFLVAWFDAVQRKSQHWSQLGCVAPSLEVFTDQLALENALECCVHLIAPLELICVLAAYIAACNPMDVNAVAAGCDSDLHKRILKYGRDGMVDFTQFGLARMVILASKTISDVCKYASTAAALALSLSHSISAKDKGAPKFSTVQKRLLIPREGSSLAGGLKDVQIVGSVFDLAVVVQGSPGAIAAAQDQLAFEHGVLSLLQPRDFFKLDDKQKVPDAGALTCLGQGMDLSFLGEGETKQIKMHNLLYHSGNMANKVVEDAVTRAAEPPGANHVTVLGFCAGAHLLFSCKGKLNALGSGMPLDVECIDVLMEVKKGNHKPVDRKRPVSLSAVKGTAAESVAVVGMSCRVPGAESVEEFWQNLLDGKDMCSKIPERLFRVEDYQSKAYKDKNTMRASTGNFIDRPGFWDPEVFGCDMEMAQKLDPQQRLALLVAMEALEKSGYAPKAGTSNDPATFGTIIGCCSDDMLQNRAHKIEAPFISALLRPNIPTKINQFYGWSGPAVTLDTACSGSLVAIESACSHLLQGKCNAVLTGGVNILTQPQIFLGLDRGFFLSPTGQCKTLDDKGDGYSRADAVSMVVLKRLSDAINEGDNILGIVNSAATNHSGESYSITHPHYQTQRRLYRSCMTAAHLDSPNQVHYAELHGTGTAAGDFEEITGVVTTYAKTRPKDRPLIIGSVKANVGHSESCSGATSLVKALLVFQNSLVPRHIGIRSKLNTKLPNLAGIHIPLEGTKVSATSRDTDDRVFTVSNFSAAAGNTSLVLRAPPLKRRKALALNADALLPCLFVLSGATLRSLKDNADNLLAFLTDYPDTDVRELCFILTAQRIHHAHRISGIVNSIDDIRSLISKHQVKHVQRLEPAKVAFVFSGQGAQYLGMGKELFQTSPHFKTSMQKCNDISKALGFGCFLSAIYPSGEASEASPVHYQLAIVSLEIGLMRLLQAWGTNPVAALGHSLGEYSALHAAGVLSLQDTLRLVGNRAQLMVKYCEAGASTMLAIKAVEGEVLSLLKRAGVTDCEIACYNSSDDLVLAGPLQSIQKVKLAADTNQPKLKSMVLSVPYAFHSEAVQPLIEPYLPIASLARYNTPRIAIGANSGELVERTAFFNGEYLVKHLRNPVRFANAVDALTAKTSVDCLVELGPHATCIPMLRSIFSGQLPAPALIPTLKKGVSSWTSLTTTLLHLFDHGVVLDWLKVHATLGSDVLDSKLAAKLPTYAFDLDNYWIDYADRGLRDHLTEQQCQAVKRVKGAATARKHSFPVPKTALLSSCTRLELKEPSTATFDALINEQPFKDMVMGHYIVGFALTPATVFAELALEAGSYVLEQLSGVEVPLEGLEVTNLAMFSSLYPDNASPRQSVQVELVGSPYAAGGASVSFFSSDRTTGHSHQHSSCTVTVANPSTIEREWKRLKHLIADRIATLRRDPATVLRRQMVYRRFETIVSYSPAYQGIEQAFLNDSGQEAVSEVYLQPTAPSGNFVCSPMLLDSLGQLTGFISNVGVASEGQVYIADGIGRIVVTPQLSSIQPGAGQQLIAWARMEPSNGRCVGDVWFTDSSHQFMGCMQDVVFKQLKRSALERLVSMGAAQAISREAFVPSVSVKKTKKSKMSDSAIILPASDGASDIRADYVHLAGPSVFGHALQPIFLLPDGSGSAGCFSKFLEQDWQVPVFGLNSPFLGNGKTERWTGGIAQVSAAFFHAIIQIQPEGPYAIGGYSMGACCAVEVARILAATGRNVETLVLLECPALNKKHLPPLPPGSLDHILAKVESPAGRRHFEQASKAVPGHSFSFDWPEPSKVIIINAIDESLTPNLMTSKPEDWKEVFKVADLSVQNVPGNHQTFLQGALDIVSKCFK